VITVERRRRWGWTDKQQIVDETLMPGASISAVTRRYGLHPSQVFAWRKAVREGDIAQYGFSAIAGLPRARSRWKQTVCANRQKNPYDPVTTDGAF
jgi:transposase-like protein